MDRNEKKNLHAINGGKIDFNMFAIGSIEEEKLLQLLEQKKRILKEYDKVVKILEPLIVEEHHLGNQLKEINQQVCSIEGHRFNNDLTISNSNSGVTYRCEKCGMLVPLAMVTKRDVFTSTQDNKYGRILYKK